MIVNSLLDNNIIDKIIEKRKIMTNNERKKKYIEVFTEQIKILTIELETIYNDINICESKLSLDDNYYVRQKLLPFNKADNESIFDEEIIECMQKGDDCITALVSKIHFNDRHAQNMNIFLHELNNTNAEVFHDGKWCQARKDKVCDFLMRDKQILLYKRFKEWTNEDKYTKDIDDYMERMTFMNEEEARKHDEEYVKNYMNSKRPGITRKQNTLIHDVYFTDEEERYECDKKLISSKILLKNTIKTTLDIILIEKNNELDDNCNTFNDI